MDEGKDAGDINDWMAGRWRQVAGAGDDEMAGRDAWTTGTRNGLNPPAATYSDLLKLGALAQSQGQDREPFGQGMAQLARKSSTSIPRTNDQAPRGTVSPSQSGPTPPPLPAPASPIPEATFGGLHAYSASDADMSELRRQQARFHQVMGDLDRKNAWLAVPALAPAATVLGMEGGAAVASRLAAPVEAPPPFKFPGPAKAGSGGGDNFQAYIGRQADQALKELAGAKQGWDPQPRIVRDGRTYIPDAGTPARNPTDLTKRYYLEQKPNTVSGRAAAARDVRYYEDAIGEKVRAIFYNPADFL